MDCMAFSASWIIRTTNSACEQVILGGVEYVEGRLVVLLLDWVWSGHGMVKVGISLHHCTHIILKEVV
jgi:hypothetical protein